MLSNENTKGHENTVIIGAFIALILLGPIVSSGIIVVPLLAMIALLATLWKRSRNLAFMAGGASILWVAWLYHITPFSMLEMSQWRLFILDRIAPWILEEPPTTRWEIALFKYASYSLKFWPLGAACWFGLAYKMRWHEKIWQWINRQRQKDIPAEPNDIHAANTYVPEENPLKKYARIGDEAHTGEPVALTEEMRLRHTQILGATGYGKTESVLKTLIHNDIRNGRGVLLIDGKGDSGFRNQIIMASQNFGRFEDVCYFNFSDPVRTMTYNPVLNGSATEIRDRIIDALDWSEEYYKKCASSALLLTLQIFEHRRQKPTLEKIVGFLMNPGTYPGAIPSEVNALYKDFRENYAKRLPEIKGLITDLNNLILSGGGKFLSDESPDIDLLTAVREKKIIILQVSTLDFGMTARSFGRLVIQDLKAMCGILNREADVQRDLFCAYIDEFESFAHESFNELLSKARSAGIGITICHQSMGDLEKIGPFFQKQITENTNNKIILRVNDEETVEYFANMAGTKHTTRTTHQVEEDIFWTRKTGVGSRRDVEEFIIHPNVFRNLKIGEAVVLLRNTGKAHVTKLSRISPYGSNNDYVEFFHERARTRKLSGQSEEKSANALPQLSKAIF
jgi:type IV secretory pathway TraG/TraD family ATPase VirD4